MTRRSKPSILEEAIQGDWKFSATLSIIICIAIYGVMPFITSPLLKAVAVGLSPLGLFLAVIFGFIAVIKFILLLVQKNAKNKSRLINSREDSIQNDLNTRTTILDSQLEQPNNWTLKLIQDLEWKRFEELSIGYYQEMGVKAEATSLGADGGIDIKLYQDNSDNPTSIVQCKAWKNKQVGVKEVREFLGVMTHEKIITGFYITSGEFSGAAKEIATANGITLINGEKLLVIIKELPTETQQKLLASVTRGDYITPTCPKCDVKMTKRSSKRGHFWGCKNYPKCHQMLHLRSLDK